MNRIKELRELANETQEELGKILNVSKATISKYEKGTVEVSNDTLIKLAIHFNVTTDYILGRDNDLKSIDDRLKKHNISTAASADIDLNKYAELDDDKKDFVKKQMNAMIDMFLQEKKKKNK